MHNMCSSSWAGPQLLGSLCKWFCVVPSSGCCLPILLTWCASTFHKRTTHTMPWPSPTGRTSYTPQPGIRPETQYIDYKEKTEWDVGQSCLTWYSPQDSVHTRKRTFDKWRPRCWYMYKVICLIARADTWLYTESDLHLVRKACGDQALWYMVLAGFKAAQAVQLVYTCTYMGASNCRVWTYQMTLQINMHTLWICPLYPLLQCGRQSPQMNLFQGRHLVKRL